MTTLSMIMPTCPRPRAPRHPTREAASIRASASKGSPRVCLVILFVTFVLALAIPVARAADPSPLDPVRTLIAEKKLRSTQAMRWA